MQCAMCATGQTTVNCDQCNTTMVLQVEDPNSFKINSERLHHYLAVSTVKLSLFHLQISQQQSVNWKWAIVSNVSLLQLTKMECHSKSTWKWNKVHSHQWLAMHVSQTHPPPSLPPSPPPLACNYTLPLWVILLIIFGILLALVIWGVCALVILKVILVLFVSYSCHSNPCIT